MTLRKTKKYIQHIRAERGDLIVMHAGGGSVASLFALCKHLTTPAQVVVLTGGARIEHMPAEKLAEIGLVKR